MKGYELAYDLGQVVYLKTDVEQKPRIVTGITIRETGIVYELSSGTDAYNHYGFELSSTKDQVMTITQD